MSPLHWIRKAGRRGMPALVAAIGVEAWLLVTDQLQMDGPAFEALCALSCWLPTWACADLLSSRRSGDAGQREWTLKEVQARALSRLVPCLLVLAVWCGTFTVRSLLAELAMPTPPFIRNINDREDLAKIAFAWTTVFVASAFAYGMAAGLCSALSKRRRRWLITPAVVVGASLICFLFLSLPVFGKLMSSTFETLSSDPAKFWRSTLTSPNYLIGAHAALGTLEWLSLRNEGLIEWIAKLVGTGISLYCWTATVYFLSAGLLFLAATLWIARNRYRRHPCTATADRVSGCLPEETVLQAG